MDRDEAIQILGLQEPFTLEDVAKAFKRMAIKTHPDRGGSEDDFKKLNDAKAYIIKFFDKKSEPKPFIKNQWGKETPVRIIVRLTFSWSLLDIVNGVNKTHSISVDGKIVQFHYNEPPRKVKKFRGIEKRIVRTVSGIQMIIITHEIANVSIPFYKLEVVNDYDLKLTILEKTDQKYLKFFDDRINIANHEQSVYTFERFGLYTYSESGECISGSLTIDNSINANNASKINIE